MLIDFAIEKPQLQAAIRRLPFHTWIVPPDIEWAAFFRTKKGIMIRFNRLADFEISAGGATVKCLPVPDIAHHTLEHLYRNQVLPLALSKLGKQVFHGSAVEVGTSAIAFLGESGRGKSTLAAGFASSGRRFLTDDGLIVEPGEQGSCLALPSHPSIRLWRDSQEQLLDRSTPMAPAIEYTSKGQFLSGEYLPFCDTARPLRAAFFLGDGSSTAITISRLTPPETMIAWVQHSFLLDVEDRDLLKQNFSGIAQLAAGIDCYYLDYPRDYELLGQVMGAIADTIEDINPRLRPTISERA